ncbi:Mitogen-activated protein kinase kinase kinase 5 [Varanus komodoensis]|nr:Mitogen-activated protein kinase kinase kinase 5 [Varanus komodoensis]
MSDAFRQPSLFYHLGVRESFSMANNIILYCDTNADSLQSLKEIICQKNNYNKQLSWLFITNKQTWPCTCWNSPSLTRKACMQMTQLPELDTFPE